MHRKIQLVLEMVLNLEPPLHFLGLQYFTKYKYASEYILCNHFCFFSNQSCDHSWKFHMAISHTNLGPGPTYPPPPFGAKPNKCFLGAPFLYREVTFAGGNIVPKKYLDNALYSLLNI